MSRGMLTEEIQEKAKSFLGYEITVRELRLLPYLDYTIKNSGGLTNINTAEMTIVQQWINEGHLSGSLSRIYVTKEFYDFMQEILWMSYVVKEAK